MDDRSNTPADDQQPPKKLLTKRQREMARHIRDRHWLFMERCAKHDPLWFCVWNKYGKAEAADEMRECLISGMEILAWVEQHKDWFIQGEWDEQRYAAPYRLTDAGRQALAEREKHDMEPVYGGMVEPGWQCIPLPRAA